MVLIGLLAKKQHGKDTTADHLVKNYNFEKIAYATPLKNVCKELFDFNEEQLYGDEKEKIDDFWGITPRGAFQYVGTELVRKQMGVLLPEVGDAFWVKVMERKLMNDNNLDKNIVISDVRFQNEVDLIKKCGGIIIKIERNLENQDNHLSEMEIDNIKNYDHKINNNSGILELYDNIDNIIKLYKMC